MLLLGPSDQVKAHYNVLSGIVPNLIELPMKYDELNIDHDSGVIFQDQIINFVCQKYMKNLHLF